MATPLDTIGQAIDSVDRLRKTLGQGKSKQVTSKQDQISFRAVALAWFKSVRPALELPATAQLLEPLDNAYNELLVFSEKATGRSKYKTLIKTLKVESVRFRSQIVTLTTSGQISVSPKPDLSKLVSDKALLAILDRRWDETINCIDGAPLAAIVMVGALLEALLFSRIEREPNKDPIFKLKCTPIDHKSGKPKKYQDWTLNDYMNACYEMEWIRKPTKDIGAILRDYRNLIHPREELKQGIQLNSDDAKMYWAIFSIMADQIVKSA